MEAWIPFAFASAFCYAAGMIFMQVGLAHAPVRAGAAIGVPTTALIFWVLAPITVDPADAVARALGLFVLVGLFFPAAVTLIMYESNRRLGAASASTASSATPLFAGIGAVLWLGETVTPSTIVGTAAIVFAVWLLAGRSARVGGAAGWFLLLPLAAALLRAVAQAATKAGLDLWPSPFAAALVGYTVSAVTLIAVRRAASLPRARTSAKGVACFTAVGVCNGGAVLTMNFALLDGPVSVVSPIIAAHPLITLALGAVFLREERIDGRIVAGTLLTLAGVTLLVALR